MPPGVAHGKENGVGGAGGWEKIMPILVRASTKMLRQAHGGASAVSSSAAADDDDAEVRGCGPANGILVVRRDPASKTGRALLNHGMLLAALRLRFPRCAVSEYAHNASLASSIGQWRAARLVIAPHGAGMTNMLFMRPRGHAVELVPPLQKGRIYGQIARVAALHWTSCTLGPGKATARSARLSGKPGKGPTN